jgi:hypothetical protein
MVDLDVKFDVVRMPGIDEVPLWTYIEMGDLGQKIWDTVDKYFWTKEDIEAQRNLWLDEIGLTRKETHDDK